MNDNPHHPLTLTTDLLRFSYANGYFPMPSPDQTEIYWYNPDPRTIIPLDGYYVSRSTERSLRNRGYHMTVNKAFSEVMEKCSDRPDTWINAEFKRVYGELHQEGDAHSVEVWLGERLVGGVYGVSLRGAFFAESKFHLERDASKVALYHLIQVMKKRGLVLLEVQFLTPHLKSLGAIEIPAEQYQEQLGEALAKEVNFASIKQS